MSYYRKQFEDLIRRTLEEVDTQLASDAAVMLLLGTAAQESAFGYYLRQIKGPAIGCFQMEPTTFRLVQDMYEVQYPVIAGRKAEEMEWDLKLAIIMARLLYKSIPKPLPAPDDRIGQANYWKQFYNTPKGKGTIEEYLSNLNTFVKGV